MRSLLALCISAKLSGGELYTVQLLAALQGRGWRCALAGSGNPGLQEAAESRGIRYLDTNLGPKLGRKTALRLLAGWNGRRQELRALLERERPDVALLQYKLEQLLWQSAGIRGDYAVLEHGPIPELIRKLRPARQLYAQLLAGSTANFAASVPARDALRAWHAGSVLLAAGLDPARREAALQAAPRLREQLSRWTAGADRIGIYAGRLAANKGVYAAATAVAGMDGAGLVIAGEGPEAGRLRDLAGAHPNIHLLGRVDDALPYIAACDFGVLLTSDRGEGRPLFGLECAAVGVPLIGPAGSAAVRALHAELGGNAVIMAGPEAALEPAIRRAAKFPPVYRTWDEAAETMDSVLQQARRHPSREPVPEPGA